MSKIRLDRALIGGALSFCLAVLAIDAYGCGGTTSSVDQNNAGSDAATGSDSSQSNGSDASTNTSADGGNVVLAAACPTSVPGDQNACSDNGLECEYGDDIQIACDDLARCDGTKWTVTTAECVGGEPDASTCPSTLASVPQNTACADNGLECQYATGVCYCTIDHSGSPQIWTCFPPAGCPYPRPRIGQTCTADAQQCDYSTCGASIACTDGTWHVGNGGCHP